MMRIGAAGGEETPCLSPILAAGVRLREIMLAIEDDRTDTTDLWREHGKLETEILAALISTPAEAVTVLVVAASDVFTAIGFEDDQEWAKRSLLAVARAARFLAQAHQVEMAELDCMLGALLIT